jgi:hypothetical protein
MEQRLAALLDLGLRGDLVGHAYEASFRISSLVTPSLNLESRTMLRIVTATRWPSIRTAPPRSTSRNRSTFHRFKRSAPIVERRLAMAVMSIDKINQPILMDTASAQHEHGNNISIKASILVLPGATDAAGGCELHEVRIEGEPARHARRKRLDVDGQVGPASLAARRRQGGPGGSATSFARRQLHDVRGAHHFARLSLGHQRGVASGRMRELQDGERPDGFAADG